MANFNLADLMPKELLTFTDAKDAGGDGTVYDVKTGQMFSAEEYIQILRAYKELTQMQAQKPTDEEAEENLRLYEQRANELFAMLIPKMPAARQAAIPFVFKNNFIQWWNEQQPKGAAGELVRATTKTPRGKRSPAASPSTGATPTTG